MSRPTRLSILLAVISMTGSAAAQDQTSEALADASAQTPRPQSRGEPTRSVSVGLTNAGSVAHSVELDDTETLFVKHGSTDTRWGTAELVAMVEDAAIAVGEAHPDSRLTVGDLSRPHGGRAHPHASHRAGRDVDLGFYLTDAESGEQLVVDRFVNMSRGGQGRDQRGRRYRFDAERNWALMAALLADERVDIQFVLVNPSIRRLLLRYAARTGADADLTRRFRDVSARRSGSASHRSHFHVRVYCAADDRPRCVDAPPFHAWIFTSEEEVQKRLMTWREHTPVRARPHRRPRRRSRMRRRAMRSRMAMRSMARRGSMATPMGSRAMRRSTMEHGASTAAASVATRAPSSGEP